MDRATAAARASRRTTVLWTRAIDDENPIDDASLALQNACPQGVSVLRCERHEEAAEHILACEQRAATEGAATAAQLTPGEVEEVIDGVHTHLAEVWGVKKHDIEFLLATKPLSALARVRNQDDWEALLRETEGLLDPALLHTAVEWITNDRTDF